MSNKITDIIDAEEIHIIYDSYLKKSLKRHERLRRTAEVEPIEFANLSRQSPKPEQLERFGPVQLTRSTYTSISRMFFAEIFQNSWIRGVRSSCNTQTDRRQNCKMFCGEAHSVKPEIKSKKLMKEPFST